MVRLIGRMGNKSTVAMAWFRQLVLAAGVLGILSNGTAQAADIVLEIPVFSGGYGTAFYEDTARQFEALRPGVKVNLYGDPRIADKVRVRVIDGHLPDATLTSELLWPVLIHAGKVLDLTAALAGPNWEGDARWGDTFLPGALDAWQIDSHTYGLPFAYACWTIFYNKALFRTHGWEVPRTWEDFFALTGKIQAAGLTPVSLPGTRWLYPDSFLRAASHNLLGDTAWRTLNNPAATGARLDARYVRAAEVLQRVTQHATAPGWEGEDHTGAEREFLTGRAVMTVSGSWFVNEMRDKIPTGFELGEMNFPVFPDGVADPTTIQTGSDCFFVFATGDVARERLTVDFLRFLTSRARAEAFVRSTDSPAAVRGVPGAAFSPLMQDTAAMIAQARAAFSMPQTMLQPPAIRQAEKSFVVYQNRPPGRPARSLPSACEHCPVRLIRPDHLPSLGPHYQNMSSATSQTHASPLSVSRPATFAERCLIAAFSALPHGRMTLELPDGTCHIFGDRATGTDEVAPGVTNHARISVRHPAFFKKCLLHGDLGFAESFIDGDWETPDLTAVVGWFVLNHSQAPTLSGSRRARLLALNFLRFADRLRHRLRPDNRASARRNIAEHYDLSNDFFALWLDDSMMYSSARWERDDASLEEAQATKNDTLCRLLRLQPDDHVLEIGTGWGGWSLHAARKYGCRITTVTLSRQQHDLAVRHIAAAGLSERIEVRLQDYRDITGQYDKIVSIEMIEAVGHRQLPVYAAACDRLLKPDGLLALQFITVPDHRYEALQSGVDFIQKHIFPGSLLISVNRINHLLSEQGGFVLQSFADFGADYARTLRLWRENFNLKLGQVRALEFDDRFIRKWHYYLSYCEAAFALRHISVVHTLHSRANNLSLHRT